MAGPRNSSVRELAPVGEDQLDESAEMAGGWWIIRRWSLAMSRGYEATRNRCPFPAGHSGRYVTSVLSGSPRSSLTGVETDVARLAEAALDAVRSAHESII